MRDKYILLNLALGRGAMMEEKRLILKKHFPGASPGFMQLTSLYYTILILVYKHPNCSLFRLYEHTRIKNKISINILIQFGFLTCDIKNSKYLYNITPLTRLIIQDLIQAYRHNLLTFEQLNKIDKKANYTQIKAKIKTLKQK